MIQLFLSTVVVLIPLSVAVGIWIGCCRAGLAVSSDILQFALHLGLYLMDSTTCLPNVRWDRPTRRFDFRTVPPCHAKMRSLNDSVIKNLMMPSCHQHYPYKLRASIAAPVPWYSATLLPMVGTTGLLQVAIA
jgi:hypothetical protein